MNTPTFNDFLIIVVWYFALFFVVVYLSVWDDNTTIEHTFNFPNYEENLSKSVNCRHTQQGAHFVTDDQGFFCRKGEELEKSGCCPRDNLLLHNTCMTCVYCKDIMKVI